MPTALRRGPYRFYFYPYDCREPRHMHIDRENLSAKLWLDPDVRVEQNLGYNRHELRVIERLTRENVEKLRNCQARSKKSAESRLEKSTKTRPKSPLFRDECKETKVAKE